MEHHLCLTSVVQDHSDPFTSSCPPWKNQLQCTGRVQNLKVLGYAQPESLTVRLPLQTIMIEVRRPVIPQAALN
eukprot:3360647-Rhodomonas_salina.1